MFDLKTNVYALSTHVFSANTAIYTLYMWVFASKTSVLKVSTPIFGSNIYVLATNTHISCSNTGIFGVNTYVLKSDTHIPGVLPSSYLGYTSFAITGKTYKQPATVSIASKSTSYSSNPFGYAPTYW